VSDVLSADGRILHLRPVRPDDAGALRALYEQASEESRRLRFFAVAGAETLDAEVRRLTRPPGDEHHALLAEDGGDVIGVAGWERLPEPGRAEFALLVADAWHGRGVGTLLLEQLVTAARAAGVRELLGDVLPENVGMSRVAAGLAPGGPVRHGDGVTVVAIPTDPDDRALSALDLRDRTAERSSLRPLLAPRSVAVVGAGRRPGGIGHEVLRNLVEYGFAGPIYAINPNADSVAGVPSYKSLAELPEPPDLVVVAVPAASVAEVLKEAKGGAAVVLSSRFGEEGPEGAERALEMLRVARSNGVRVLGPNCLGLLNTDPAVRLNATFAAGDPADAGGLAVASQSGAVGIAFLDHAARTGTGLSSFVSLGNKADISGNDLLAYWFDDPGTRAVALYLESFGNPRKFARMARALARRKPVLAVKSGRSASGQRAGASHTAAAAAPDVAVDSLFAQAGVVRTNTLGELLDAARMLVDQPLATGLRLGIAGNAGGLNVLAADATTAAGLEVPVDPLDLGAEATPQRLGEAVSALASSGRVDLLLAIFGGTRSNSPDEALDALAKAFDEAPAIPMAAVLVGLADPPATLGRRRVPVYHLPEQAVAAMGQAANYAGWRRRPLGSRPQLSDVDKERARSMVDGAVGWQPWEVTAQLLECYGIPVVPTTIASDLDTAVAAANHFGYPVVVKTADPRIVHKTDLGAVALNLPDAFSVASAYATIGARVRQNEPIVAVQPMRSGGVELVAGVVHDPLFGSLVMVGLGGVYTDLLNDRTLQLLPVTDRDAAMMWRRLRGSALLTGYRSSPAADTEALEDLLMRLGRLAEDLPEVAELDLNPLMVFPHQLVAVDAKLRLQPIGPEPDATSRALRSAE
jgi:acyl-CoA synthetase (NDP forming)/GNAT superfamily N-acetyltransferase